MRLDRFLSMSLFGPLGRAGAGRLKLPVLMYHSVSDDPEASVSAYYRTAVSPELFERQMRQLQVSGYRGVSLQTGLKALRERNRECTKMVAITFDDGFRDFGTTAFPALQRHGFSATVFLPTGFIKHERRQFSSRECLTWTEVLDLHGAGIQFGSHTVSHPKLIQLDWPAIVRELVESKKEIEDQLATPINSFAYPYAFPGTHTKFVARLSDELRKAGYACCATTRIGRVTPEDDFYRLKRLPVNSNDDLRFFMAKIQGGYDWVAWPQAVIKSAKQWTTFSDAKEHNSQPAGAKPN